MTTDKSQLALIMAYRKILAEKEEEISRLKQQHPDLLTIEEIESLNEIFLSKRTEFNNMAAQIEKIDAELSELSNNRSLTADQERNRHFQLLQDLKAKYKNTEEELKRLVHKLEITSTEECQRYIQILDAREKYKHKLEALEKNVDPESLQHISKIQAAEKKATPFGPVVITKNLYDDLQKFSDWLKEFSIKHKLQMQETKEEKKLQFSSSNKDLRIEVTQEKISGSWGAGNEKNVIAIMVELYLKAIQTQKVDKHLVEGKTAEVTKQIELELAKQFKISGYEQDEINNKKIDDILNPKSDTEPAPTSLRH